MVRRKDDPSYSPTFVGGQNPRRGGNFRTTSPQRQEEAKKGLVDFGINLPARISSEIEAQKRVASGNADPAKKKQALGVVNRLQEAHSMMRGKPVETSLTRSVNAVVSAARMPVEAARIASREQGRLILPEAGLFYAHKFDLTSGAASAHARGMGINDRHNHVVSSLIATPQLSPMTDPQTETQAGAGLSFIRAYGHHGSVNFSDENARQINASIKDPTHHLKRSGVHSIAELSPPVLAKLASHHRASVTAEGKSKYSDMFSTSKIDLPGSLSDAMADFGNLGTGGVTKGARAIEYFDKPLESFGGAPTSGGAHKVGSYTLDSLKYANPTYREGVTHWLGLHTHGDAWAQQHPEAHQSVLKGKDTPEWHVPHGVIDTHAGQLHSALDPELRSAVGGEILRPENFFKNETALPKASGRHPFNQTGADMGYYLAEEANTRAGRTKHFTIDIGGTSVSAPGEVTQALGWAGKQAQDKGESLRNIMSAQSHSGIIDPNNINQLKSLRTYRA